MKKNNWIIPLLWPVVSQAQAVPRSAAPEGLMAHVELPPRKQEKFGAYLRPLPTAHERSQPAPVCVDQSNRDRANLSVMNRGLLEKIESLTQHCLELENENKKRLSTLQQQRVVQIQLQEEIRQLKLSLQKNDQLQ